jgi:hypothetical protein
MDKKYGVSLENDKTSTIIDLNFGILTPFSAIFQLYHGDQL